MSSGTPNGANTGTGTVSQCETFPLIVELNVGGVFYTTSLATLTKEPDSLLGEMFTGRCKTPLIRDSKGKYFIDRDGVLFRYILDYLRNSKLVLPENFHERDRLRLEADYFRLPDMVQCLNSVNSTVAGFGGQLRPAGYSPLSPSIGKPGCITVGYRGSFAFGRDGLADVKFRKLSRILVCGRVNLCREVFGETLNESRDPDRGTEDRYTTRFFLKHTFLEQSFDMLQEAGFKCLAACASGTSCGGGSELKPGMDSEENRWNHYNEFVFVRS
ncbi:hypothetical protein CHUAL_001556 [Chamberlinius hualienensis]